MLGLVRRKRWTPSGGVIESKNLARPRKTGQARLYSLDTNGIPDEQGITALSSKGFSGKIKLEN